MEDIKPRLKKVRASVAELAEFMGVDYFVADRIVNGKRKTLRTDEADSIRRFFESRERPVFSTSDATERTGGVSERSGARAEIPLFGGADTNEGWMLSLGAHSQVARIMPHPAQTRAGKAFAVEVVDDSMSPRFEMGEIAYVAVGVMPRRGQDCLIEYKNLTARILQFVERNDRQVVLRQLNPPKQVILKAGDGTAVHAIVGRG